MKLFAFSIFLVKPIIQLPRSSLIKPPPLVEPKTASEDLSILNFTQPELGFSHLTCLIAMRLLHLGRVAQSTYSMAYIDITLTRFGLTILLLKTTWFCCFQINQMATGKRMCQGTPLTLWVDLELALEVNQVLIVRLMVKWLNSQFLNSLSFGNNQ